MAQIAVRADDIVTLNRKLNFGFKILQNYGNFILLERKVPIKSTTKKKVKGRK